MMTQADSDIVTVDVELEGPNFRRTMAGLRGPVLVAGRSPSSAIALPHSDVSRRHAEFELARDAFMVRDFSTNGVFVAGQRVPGQQRVEYGRPVAIGPFTLKLVPPALPDENAEAANQRFENRLIDAENDRLKRWLHELLLKAIDLRNLKPEELRERSIAPRVLQLIDELLDEHARQLPDGLDRARLRKELADEALGLGPLEDSISDGTITEIMVVDRANIYIERKGRLELTPARFPTEGALRAAIERIVTPLGRRIDESTPLVDARLKDGSRVNAVIPPLALAGPCITIRKFSKRRLGARRAHRLRLASTRAWRAFSTRSVVARRNIVVSGGTGSGKTTLLNVLSSAIPRDERIVTIEDAAELQLKQPHVVSLETRPREHGGQAASTPSAIWCGTRCACAPTASSSASAAAARRSTCCRR